MLGSIYVWIEIALWFQIGIVVWYFFSFWYMKSSIFLMFDLKIPLRQNCRWDIFYHVHYGSKLYVSTINMLNWWCRCCQNITADVGSGSLSSVLLIRIRVRFNNFRRVCRRVLSTCIINTCCLLLFVVWIWPW